MARNGIKKFRLCGSIIIILLTFSCRLNAETDTGKSNSQELDSYIRHIPSRSVETVPGEIKIIDSGSEYGYEFKAFGKLPVKFSLENRYIGIKDTLTNVDLPSHLIGLTTGLETTFPFFSFNKTYLRIGLNPSFYADDWDFPSSSFRLSTYGFLIYQPNPEWTFLYGIALYPDFDLEILPVLGFIYQPNNKLAFNIVPKRPNITYAVNDKISLFAEGGSSFNNEYEVTRGASKNVVLRYKETHLGTGIKFKLNKYIESSVSAGGIFNRSLRYRDDQGKANIKDGFYTEFRVKISC